MRIVYVGGFDEVEVPYVEDGTPKLFRALNGQPAECPNELALMLLQQTDVWAESPVKAGRKTEAITPAG